MGISKLYAFMKDKYNWQRLNIAGRRLVIDGNSLCHYLYCENHEWRLGGSYPAFYGTVTQFFQTLTSHSITPVVVFDGIRNKKGNDAIRKRRETYVHDILKSQGRQTKVPSFNEGVSPVFVKEVFLDALSDLEVEFYFADGEADGEIAAIANHYDCPVLSLDSDFYIYDITGGFVPLGLLQWEKECTIPKCEVAVYHLSSFINQFNLPNESLRFLIPAILGNDSWKPVVIPEISSPDSIVMNLVTYISKFPSIEAFLTSVSDKRQLLDNQFRKAKEQYTVDAKDLRDLDKFAKLGRLPQWVLERFRQGCFQIFMLGALEFGYCTLRPVVEDLDQPSSYLTGRSLRQSIYGILGCHGPVTETLREHGTQLVDAIVKPKLPPPIMLPAISEVDGRELKCIFHSVLDFDTPIQEAIEKLPKEWQLAAISLKFCIRQCRPEMTPDSIKALVACFLSCSSYKDTSTATYRYTLKQGSSELKALHGFAQWQCVHFDVIALNQLMCEPYEYVSPAKLFDGQVAMHYATLFRKGRDAVVKEVAGYDLALSERIYTIVTDQRDERKPKTERKKHCAPQVGAGVHYGITTQNKFAILGELGSEENLIF